MSYKISNLFSNYPILKSIEKSILDSYEILKLSFEKNNTLFICGNGGSASDAEHMVGELMKSFLIPRPINNKFSNKLSTLYNEEGNIFSSKLQEGLKAISLNSHPSFITAYGNDVDYEMVFAQQLYVLGGEGDVIIGFSTSGNSKNIKNALKVAKAKGIKTILFTGIDGGECADLADYSIKAPASETYRIQEYHLPIYHALCAMLEEYFYGK